MLRAMIQRTWDENVTYGRNPLWFWEMPAADWLQIGGFWFRFRT
jgi:hypothetical protein